MKGVFFRIGQSFDRGVVEQGATFEAKGVHDETFLAHFLDCSVGEGEEGKEEGKHVVVQHHVR